MNQKDLRNASPLMLAMTGATDEAAALADSDELWTEFDNQEAS
jgi:hypothetical protein